MQKEYDDGPIYLTAEGFSRLKTKTYAFKGRLAGAYCGNATNGGVW